MNIIQPIFEMDDSLTKPIKKELSVLWFPGTYALREKCPNTEFILVRIFLYSVRIQENTDQ